MSQATGLFRRLGAMLYDALLILALLFLATIPFLAASAGEAVAPETLAYQVTLVAVVYVFLVGFWCRRGSTLGMLALLAQAMTPLFAWMLPVYAALVMAVYGFVWVRFGNLLTHQEPSA